MYLIVYNISIMNQAEQIISQLNIPEIIEKDLEYVAVIDQDRRVDFVSRQNALDPEQGNKRVIVGLFGLTKNEQGEDCMVLQRRAPDKKEFPNCLTFAGSGHVGLEDVQEGSIDFVGAMDRELKEETGIDVGRKIELLSNFESIREDEQGRQIRLEMILGVTQIDYQMLQDFVETSEVKGIEVVPLQKMLSQIATTPEDREEGFKFSIPFEQSIIYLFNNARKFLHEP